MDERRSRVQLSHSRHVVASILISSNFVSLYYFCTTFGDQVDGPFPLFGADDVIQVNCHHEKVVKDNGERSYVPLKVDGKLKRAKKGISPMILTLRLVSNDIQHACKASKSYSSRNRKYPTTMEPGHRGWTLKDCESL